MPRKLKAQDTTATFCRSYLVTLGLAFAAFGIFIWYRDGAEAWPWWLLTLFVLGGVVTLLFGLLGPTSRMEDWAEVSARNDASLIIMVLSYPVYLVLSPFYDGR
jgi:uncharacterized membrane protein